MAMTRQWLLAVTATAFVSSSCYADIEIASKHTLGAMRASAAYAALCIQILPNSYHIKEADLLDICSCVGVRQMLQLTEDDLKLFENNDRNTFLRWDTSVRQCITHQNLKEGG